MAEAREVCESLDLETDRIEVRGCAAAALPVEPVELRRAKLH